MDLPPHSAAPGPSGGRPSGGGVTSVTARLRAAGCVFAEEEAALLLTEADSADRLEEMVAARVAGLPLEQILGWAEFCGLRIALEPGVFVPRRRTALLVTEAAALASCGAVVLDLCCGSGAIGVAVAHELGGVELYAVDVDAAAVRCALRNVGPIDGAVYQGDLVAPLPAALRGRVDLVVVCPPYVPTGSLRLMPPEARLHEPRQALDGGEDGLDVVRRLAEIAATWLAPGGHVLVESSEPQAEKAVAAFEANGLATRVATAADLGATVVIGTR